MGAANNRHSERNNKKANQQSAVKFEQVVHRVGEQLLVARNQVVLGWVDALAAHVDHLRAVQRALAIGAARAISAANIAFVVNREPANDASAIDARVVAAALAARVVDETRIDDAVAPDARLSVAVANAADIEHSRPVGHSVAVETRTAVTSAHVAHVVYFGAVQSSGAVAARRRITKAHTAQVALLRFAVGARVVASALATPINHAETVGDTGAVNALVVSAAHVACVIFGRAKRAASAIKTRVAASTDSTLIVRGAASRHARTIKARRIVAAADATNVDNSERNAFASLVAKTIDAIVAITAKRAANRSSAREIRRRKVDIKNIKKLHGRCTVDVVENKRADVDIATNILPDLANVVVPDNQIGDKNARRIAKLFDARRQLERGRASYEHS